MDSSFFGMVNVTGGYSDAMSILKITTFLLARMRFQPDQSKTGTAMLRMADFYGGDIISWRLDDFMTRFGETQPYDSHEDFVKAAERITASIQNEEAKRIHLRPDFLSPIVPLCKLFSDLCRDGYRLFGSGQFTELADLLDCIHGLPEALADPERFDPRSFWNTYFVPFIGKWSRLDLAALKCYFSQRHITD